MSTDDKEKKGFSVDAGGDGSVVNITGGIREDHQHVTHEQNDSHDIHDSHNTTYVLNGNQSLKDLTLDERKRKYRDMCRKLMQNGMVSKEVRRKLDERALELDLDEEEKRELEQQVKSTLQGQGAAGLSWSDKATLDLVIHLVNSNSPNLTDQLVNMEVLADKTEVDEVHYYYYLLLAMYRPEQFIQRYESRSCDSYWQSFWAFMAYRRCGNPVKANQAKVLLANWTAYAGCDLLLFVADQLFTAFQSTDPKLVLEYAKPSINQVAQLRGLPGYLVNFLDFLSLVVYSTGRLKEVSMIDASYLCYFRLFDLRPEQLLPGGVTPVEPKGNKWQSYLVDTPAAPKPNESEQVAKNVQSAVPTLEKEGIRDCSADTQTQSAASKTETTGDGQRKKWILIGGVAVVAVLLLWAPWRGNQESVTTSVNSRQEVKAPASAVSSSSSSKAPASAVSSSSSSKTPASVVSSSSSSKVPASAVSSSSSSKAPASVVSSFSSSKASASVVSSSSPSKASASAVSSSSPSKAPASAVSSSSSSKAPMTAAQWLSKGKSLNRHFKDGEAMKCFQQAAAQGSADAYLQMGLLYYNGGNETPRNNAQAFRNFQKAAEAGLAEGQYRLGLMYVRGAGCEKDLGEARKWLRKSAAQGHAYAKNELRKI